MGASGFECSLESRYSDYVFRAFSKSVQAACSRFTVQCFKRDNTRSHILPNFKFTVDQSPKLAVCEEFSSLNDLKTKSLITALGCYGLFVVYLATLFSVSDYIASNEVVISKL